MSISLTISAFIAGLLTFFAPCTLPLVPGYLAFLAGVSEKDAELVWARRKVIAQSAFFIFGFSFVFILFGMLAGFVGGSLIPYRIVLSHLGGVVVLIFGIFFLSAGRVPLFSLEKHITVPRIFRRGTGANSFLFGFSFGLGWTPCIGPILGTILTLAFVKGTAWSGALLLTVFSFGLAVPFLIVALLMGRRYTSFKISPLVNKILSIVGGLFLVLIGILLMTDNFGLLSEYFLKIFSFINYDWLLPRL
ncbi:MAG: cytochrome c biogenesis protein CcdA [Candidatus Paceibacterota bacterium]|jgi:cytochrome c-type biogenesis protein